MRIKKLWKNKSGCLCKEHPQGDEVLKTGQMGHRDENEPIYTHIYSCVDKLILCQYLHIYIYAVYIYIWYINIYAIYTYVCTMYCIYGD